MNRFVRKYILQDGIKITKKELESSSQLKAHKKEWAPDWVYLQFIGQALFAMGRYKIYTGGSLCF